MKTSKDSTSARTVAAEAAAWYVDLQAAEVSRQEQEAFAEWLRRSPVHVEEFLQLTALAGDLAHLPELAQLDANALLASAAARQRGDNVSLLTLSTSAPMGSLPETNSAPGKHASSRFTRWAMAASVAVLVVGAIGFGLVRHSLATERYATKTGEQRSLTLADGSRVQLNVRSDLRAHVDKTVRDVRLDEGEALFSVAQDASRPFRVHTPQAVIEAIGTRFNVHVEEGRTAVALLEGKVEIRQPGSPGVVRLTPGQEVSIGADAKELPQPRVADLTAAVAWTERRLIFEDAPLSEVIAEFNRYSREPFVIEDPQLRSVRITAVFDSSRTQTFASTLEAAGTLRVVHEQGTGYRIEKR